MHLKFLMGTLGELLWNKCIYYITLKFDALIWSLEQLLKADHPYKILELGL